MADTEPDKASVNNKEEDISELPEVVVKVNSKSEQDLSLKSNNEACSKQQENSLDLNLEKSVVASKENEDSIEPTDDNDGINEKSIGECLSLIHI